MGDTTIPSTPERVLDAIPDTIDFRDRMFYPTLVEVPPKITLDEYHRWGVPILDQGVEGACTGFGLATVAHYLLRRRTVSPDNINVSPRMFYEMAKRYDEWPGEEYNGSSARGAMKGWHRHGVCAHTLWPYDSNRVDRVITDERARDATERPLGSYYRVNHKDLISMHSALAEVGILYATSMVHDGWRNVGPDGMIRFQEGMRSLGGHAFAIVAYDRDGFWIQNSWGSDWGNQGFGLISYDDWLRNATDVWVARLGAPVALRKTGSTAVSISALAGKSDVYAFCTMRSHIISTGNDGRLRAGGEYGSSTEEIAEIFERTIPKAMEKWSKRRLLLYAHGGLVSEENAVQRIADYRSMLVDSEIYPLAFIWKSDYWSTLRNILDDSIGRRRPEGFLDDTKDFMLDRLDDALEPLARLLTGKAQWDEMKENALRATTRSDGGARLVLNYLVELVRRYPDIEIHLLGDSAGAVFLAPFLQMLATRGELTGGPAAGLQGYGLPVASCTLWEPACTVDLFREAYLPLITGDGVGSFSLFTLTDRAEQDDHCARIYHKSLLYLTSNAFEERARIPFVRDGVPILGMEKFIRADAELMRLIETGRIDWVLAPNASATSPLDYSTASGHGAFGSDLPTLRATFGRIAGGADLLRGRLMIHRSSAGLRETRTEIGGRNEV